MDITNQNRNNRPKSPNLAIPEFLVPKPKNTNSPMIQSKMQRKEFIPKASTIAKVINEQRTT